jgi:hypothetical protein
MTTFEQARRYLEKIPPAVSGSRGHDQFYKALASLRQKFGLDEYELLTLGREYSEHCDPPWKESEIQHKVNEVMKNVIPTHDPPRLTARCEDAQIQWPNPAPLHDTKPVLQNKYSWPDLETALKEYSQLTNASSDAEAIRFLKENHGLCEADIPPDWKVVKQGSLHGIVYPGQDIEGSPTCFHYGSFARNEQGKRFKWFLFYNKDNLGAIFLECEGSKNLVICNGAEKCAAARAAGYNAFGMLTGEDSKIPQEWLNYFKMLSFDGIIAGNDNDSTGEKANQKTAEALEQVGHDSSLIKIVQWPDGTSQGGDLNDILKQAGKEGVKTLLDGAQPYEGKIPRVLSAERFLAITRPPLQFHIDRLLPFQGKLTFSATSKFGKSMWGIQTGLALAGGNCDWLGFHFGPSVRVLYLQAEISDALLCVRLQAILRDMPPQINRDLAIRNFHIQEIAKGRPNLFTDKGKKQAEIFIERFKPGVLILDPLAAICPGLEENAAESMSLALDYFSNLTQRFGCAVLLIHHFGKGGFSRGSSVFEAWPESDLQASYVDNDREVAKVEMRLRCVFNRGPIFWQTPTEDNIWFEEMPEGWEPEKTSGGRPKSAEPKHVVMALKASDDKQLHWKKLCESVKEMTNCAETTAQTVINSAVDAGLVKHVGPLYVLP